MHEHEDSGHGSGVEASGGHEVHEHDECQSAVPVDRVSSILIVTRTDTASLRDRLSSLAQQLGESQAHPSKESENEGMPTGSRPRSTPCRMAMRGHSSAGPRPFQQMGNLASLQPMRPAASVHHQGQWYRRDPSHWTTARTGRDCPDRTPGDVPRQGDEREDLQRQAHMELKGRSLVENGGHGRTTVQVRADEKLGEALMSSSSRGTMRTSKKGYGTSKETPLPKSTSPVKPTSKTEPKKKADKMVTSPSTVDSSTGNGIPVDTAGDRCRSR